MKEMRLSIFLCFDLVPLPFSSKKLSFTSTFTSWSYIFTVIKKRILETIFVKFVNVSV